MADSTVLWLASLGFITALMGCCLLYALRQVTVLRESVDNLVADLTSVRSQQETANESLETALLKQRQDDEAASGKVDTEELLSRLRTIEGDMQQQETRIVEVSRRSAEIAASPIQKTNESALPSLSEELSRSSAGRNTADVKQIYEEILGAIKHQQSGIIDNSMASPAPAAADSSVRQSRHRETEDSGLSYSLPPPFVVYVCKSSNFKGNNYTKRIHRIQIGLQDSDVALCFGTNASAQPDVVIPIDDIVSMTLQKDKIIFDDTECVTVTVTKKSKVSQSEGQQGTSLTMRHRSPFDTVQSDPDRAFIFSVPPCPGFDEWSAFLNNHFPHKLIIKDIL